MGTLRTLIATLALGVTVACAGVKPGDQPQLAVTTMDGGTFDLAQRRGKLVVIDFWYGGADLVKGNERQLIEIYSRYADQGVVFLGVVTDKSAQQAQRYVSLLKQPWPQYHESEGSKRGVAGDWGASALTSIYVISPEGKVIWTGTSPKALEEELADAVVKHPPRTVSQALIGETESRLAATDKALSEHDRASAIRAFYRIPAEANKDRVLLQAMTAEEPKVRQAADELLQEVDPLIATKQYVEAVTRLKELLADVLPGSPAEDAARKKLATLTADPQIKAALETAQQNTKADAALAEARKLRDSGDRVGAYLKFKSLIEQFPASTAAQPARSAVQEDEKDPQLVQQAREATAAPKAKQLLSLAESYRSAGQLGAARERYTDVIRQFPDTRFALDAKSALDAMAK